jgi:peptidoglycan/xylan/chitin deacetylase (PgdA/CDA1 family)
VRVRLPFGCDRLPPRGALLVAGLLLIGSYPAGAADHPSTPVHQARVVPRPGRVALTFDDGPHPKWTPVVLDVLEEYDVRATFFVNGFRVDAYPEVAAEVVRRGHSLQNHGYGHQRLTELSDRGVRSDIVRGAESIIDATGIAPTCLRPPWGLTSGRIRGIAGGTGEMTVLWTVDSADYAHQSGAKSIERVLHDLHAGDIILMHDSIGWAARDALPTIIEAVRAAGLEFDTICDDRWPHPPLTPRVGATPGPMSRR